MHKKNVLKHLGHEGQPIDITLNEKINKGIDIVDQVKGKYVYKIFDFSSGEDIKIHNTLLTLRGESIKHILSQADKLVLFAATLGHEMDANILKTSYVSAVDMMILDACAGVKIEDVLDGMEEKIKKETTNYLTPRFSPGYGDLSLEIQKDLIDILAAKTIGIHVTDAYMLLPKKSVTGIIGISSDKMDVTYKFCDGCLLRTSCDFKKCKR